VFRKLLTFAYSILIRIIPPIANTIPIVWSVVTCSLKITNPRINHKRILKTFHRIFAMVNLEPKSEIIKNTVPVAYKAKGKNI
jgi:hypothetical protein